MDQTAHKVKLVVRIIFYRAVPNAHDQLGMLVVQKTLKRRAMYRVRQELVK